MGRLACGCPFVAGGGEISVWLPRAAVGVRGLACGSPLVAGGGETSVWQPLSSWGRGRVLGP